MVLFCVAANRFTGAYQISVAIRIVHPANSWPEFTDMKTIYREGSLLSCIRSIPFIGAYILLCMWSSF